MKNNTIIKFISIGCFILISGLIYLFTNVPNNTEELIVTSETDGILVQEHAEPEHSMNPEYIVVHVCGAIKNPGVYQLPIDSRIRDAILAAGGFKRNASEIDINQAKPITDGEQVYIPYKNQQKDANTHQQNSKLNINSATVEELTNLPGIGTSKAESIIRYREEHGFFKSIEEIKNIQGIKDGVYSKIADYIVV